MFNQPRLWETKRTCGRYLVRLALALGMLAPMLLTGVPTVQADTEVGGPIISDTIWIAANSPYIVVESVEVWEEVTLTIEPRVTVKFDSEKKLQVNGELIAQGTASNSITFTSNQASPAPGDWGNIEFTSTAITTTMDAEGNYISGSILQYCVVEYAGYEADSAVQAHSLLIDHCTVRNNDARGIYDPGTETAPSRITDNTVSENSATGDGGGVYTEYSTVGDNTVSSNSAAHYDVKGGGIYAKYSTVSGNTVASNTISASRYRYGGGIYVEYSTVSGNTVTDNTATMGGGIYAGDSTVSGNTVSSNSVTGYGGGIYAYSSTVSDNTVSSNSASSGGGIRTLGGTVSDNTISNNSATGRNVYGGGIYAGGSIVSGNTVSSNSATGFHYASGGGICAWSDSTVSGNTVSGNSAYDDGGGICAWSDSAVSGNTVSGNSAHDDGGGIYAWDSTVLTNTITANNVSWESSQGAGAYVRGSGDFLCNTVVGNSGPLTQTVGGLAIDGTPQVHYNNFYDNEPYDVVVRSSNDISGTHNYWGTVSSVDILAQVYDWYDDSGRGRFLYIPYLQEPSQDAPFPPPTGLTADLQDNSATLSWNAHPSFTTGYGYKVYYDSDNSIPPYEGTGLNEGDAPIDVGDQTAYTLTGLDPSKDYYFAVTAYDNEGHESWYSNVEWRQGGYWVYLPVVLKDH